MSVPLETLTALFLAELEAFDAFAARREVEGGLLPGRDDPDVRRMIEAMAFFSARTRAGAIAATSAAVRRIAAGTLDDLLSPCPAAMMVEAAPDPALKEPVSLPRGTLLRVVTPEGRVGLFSTERAMTVLPVAIEGAEIVEARRRLSVRIRLRAAQRMAGALELSLHVRRRGDYRASLALHDALERHLVRAFAVADGYPQLPCRVAFGSPPRHTGPRALADGDGEPGPLARIRAFFHLPEQDLSIRVSVPPAAAPWTTLAIHLELDEAFPSDLSISHDTFHLFVVPAVNAWTDLAAPIVCDGTRDRYPVRSPSPLLEGVELHGVRGVYRAERGLAPILPAALAQEGDTYELEDAGDEREPQLVLRIAGAFESPCKVQVDARWSQPSLWAASVGKLVITPQTRHLPGFTLQALGAVRKPAVSPLARDPARCLDVLALRLRPALDRRDVAGLLEILGTGGDGPYRGAHTLLDELTASESPDPERRAGGIRRVYQVAVRRRNPDEAPLARRLAAQIAALLDAWTEDAVDVEISAHPGDTALTRAGARAGLGARDAPVGGNGA